MKVEKRRNHHFSSVNKHKKFIYVYVAKSSSLKGHERLLFITIIEMEFSF